LARVQQGRHNQKGAIDLMALNFPDTPSIGQVFPASPVAGVSSWQWDGSEWVAPPAIIHQVTVNATGSFLYGALATSQNYTGLTIISGSNTVLVVSVGWDIGGGAVTPTGLSVVWDSGGSNQALTRIITSDPGTHTGYHTELWGLVAPMVGNKTLALSWTTTAHPFIVGIAFDGVDQTGGATSFPGSVSALSGTTVTVSSATSDIVMCSAVSNADPVTILGTTIYYDAAHSNYAFANRMAGAASVAIGSSGGSNHIVATNIKAA
jgi:hypothetical protein